MNTDNDETSKDSEGKVMCFLVAPSKRSDLSSHYGVCMYVCMYVCM